MSCMGSLGLTLCVISCMHDKVLSQGIGVPLELLVISAAPVLHQKASLQKICALEKKQAATTSLSALIVSPTKNALLLYHYYYIAVWPVRTANNAAIRLCTYGRSPR